MPLNAAPRGGAALLGSPILSHELLQALLVDHSGADLLSLRELRARTVTGDHVVSLLRDRVDYLAAGQANQAGGLLAAQVSQRAGQHECLAVERAALLAA